MELSREEIRASVQLALAEDIGGGDATTLATVPKNQNAVAFMRAREPLVVAGIQFAEMAFRKLSSKIKIKKLARDGQKVAAGKTLLKISGSARAILTAERVALNFVQRLSGIATLTAQFVERCQRTRARKFSTRAKRRPAGGVLRNTPLHAAAGKIIASDFLT